jgi:hypothetical protein
MSKKEFIYHPYTNEYRHKTFPISIDSELFKDMSEEELENFFNSKINDINKEISSIKKPERKEIPASDEDIKTMFSNLRKQLAMQESFKDYFCRQKTN